jgi:hypothetical protein
MTTKRILLLAALVAAAPRSAKAATLDMQPLFVTNVTGTLRVQQDLPSVCSDIDQTTTVTGGRIEMTPWEGLAAPSGARSYDLVRASLFFAPFTLHASCDGPDQEREYTDVGVQLAGSARVVAAPSSPGVYTATIPWQNMLIYEAARVDGDLEAGYKHPKEDPTATIDYVSGTVQMRVVMATKVHIDECIPFVWCGEGDFWGTLTVDLSGTILYPDSDGDGVSDPDDNCRHVANRDQSPVATPRLQVPYDITVGSCAEQRIGAAIGIDLCDLLQVDIESDAAGVFGPGPNVVSWTAVDAAGRRASGRQTVTVADKTKPEFTDVPRARELDTCGPADLGAAAAIDDCGGTPVIVNDAPRVFSAGATVVHWMATDATGNRAVAEQTVTVTDRVAPDLACVPSADPDEGGEIGYYRVSAQDACDVPAIRLGAFALADGEVIRVTRSREPGIELLGVSRSGIRHFRVGPGEQVIEAADKAGNAGRTACWPLRDDMWPSGNTRRIR